MDLTRLFFAAAVGGASMSLRGRGEAMFEFLNYAFATVTIIGGVLAMAHAIDD